MVSDGKLHGKRCSLTNMTILRPKKWYFNADGKDRALRNYEGKKWFFPSVKIFTRRENALSTE